MADAALLGLYLVHLTTEQGRSVNMDTLSVESRGGADMHGGHKGVADENETMHTTDSPVKVLCRSVSENFPVYQFQEPRRLDVRVSNYKRRLAHLRPGCGFFSSQIRPYQALGAPCLDTDYLSSGEIADRSGIPLGVVSPGANAVLQPDGHAMSDCSTKMTPAKLEKLESLRGFIKSESDRLEYARKGHSLFKVLVAEEEARAKTEILKLKRDSDNSRKMWLPPGESRETGSHSFAAAAAAAADGQLPEVPSALLQDTIEESVPLWYCVLCTIWWILEATKQGSVKHIMAFGDRFQIGRTFLAGRVWSTKLTTREESDWNELLPPPPVLPPLPNAPEKKTIYPVELKTSKWAKEIEKLKNLQKFSVEQSEQLALYLEEQMSSSKKKTARALETAPSTPHKTVDQVQGSADPKSKCTINLDVLRGDFDSVDESKKLIVHEQLTSHRQGHLLTMQKKFLSVSISGNMWQDIHAVRSTAPIESCMAARQRLYMNTSWLKALLIQLPSEVKDNLACQSVLRKLDILSKFMKQAAPEQMSKGRLLRTLGRLKPWELRQPDVVHAIQFVKTKVIYIDEEEYDSWYKSHFQGVEP